MTNDKDMYHYVNTVDGPHTKYSKIKYVLSDTGASGTYIRPGDPNENLQK